MSSSPFDKYQKSDLFLENESEEKSLEIIDSRIEGLRNRKILGLKSFQLFSVAAVITVLIAFITFFNSTVDNWEPDFIHYPYYDHVIIRGSEPTPKLDAYEAYDKNAYARAISLFQNQASLNALDSFYIGLCFQATGKFKESLNYLKEDFNYQLSLDQDVKWYLAQAKIQLEDFDSALVLLNELAEKNGFFNEKAKALLMDEKFKEYKNERQNQKDK